MEINEVHADAIYDEMKEELAGISKICGVERPAPMPAMSPFEPEKSTMQKLHEAEMAEEEESNDDDDYQDRGMRRSDFLSDDFR